MWGVFLLGSYGVLQFFVVPEWDAFWMANAEMASIGDPRPHQVRVFSMLDSPGPFAVTMMTGLVFLFVGKGVLPILAAAPGYTSFLLADVRGAWIGWVVAALIITTLVKGPLKRQLIGIMAAIAIITTPIVMTGPIAENVGSRMQTFENIQEDGSVKVRMRTYRWAIPEILSGPVGRGLGSRSMDSGILTLFWQVGWPGGFAYLTGLGLLLRDVLRSSSFFAKIVAGIAASYAIQFFAGGQLLGQVTGVLFWSLTSLAIAYETTRHKQDYPAISQS
jgi:hypothetical protein